MFDIGFWEISLIGVIALLVIGPERLPGVARNVGFWVGRMRRYVGQVRADLEREVRADELKRIMNESSGLDDLRDAVEETRSAVSDAGRQLESAGNDWASSVEAPSSREADESAPTAAVDTTDPDAGAEASAALPRSDAGPVSTDARDAEAPVESAPGDAAATEPEPTVTDAPSGEDAEDDAPARRQS